MVASIFFDIFVFVSSLSLSIAVSIEAAQGRFVRFMLVYLTQVPLVTRRFESYAAFQKDFPHLTANIFGFMKNPLGPKLFLTTVVC